jgi:uncharacterized protein
MPELVIKIRDVDERGKSFSFKLSPAWLAAAVEGTDLKAVPDVFGALELSVYQTGADYIVRGRASASLVVACSRCLGDLSMVLAADLDVVMSPRDGAPLDEEEEDGVGLDAEELGREYYSGDSLVLDEIVRDYLLLEVPMQPRCEDEQCAGQWVMQYMSTAEGSGPRAAQAVDPRFAALQKLKLPSSDDDEQ